MILGAILRYHLFRIGRYFARHSFARLITAAMFLLVFFGVGYAVYRFFLNGFMFMSLDMYLRRALFLYSSELFLLIVAVLVFVSSIITSLLGLFRAERDQWVVASPRFGIVPLSISARAFAASAWPFFIIALPALFAVRDSFGLDGAGMALGIAAIALLVALAALAAVLFLMAVSYFLAALEWALHAPFLRLGWIIALGILVLVIGAAWASVRLSSTDIVQIFRARAPNAAFAGTEAIVEQFSVFPSHLVAGVLTAYDAGEPGRAVTPFLRLLWLALAAVVLLYVLSRWYLPVWQKLQEGRFHAESAGARNVSRPIRFPRYFRGQAGALFEKEWLMLVRTPRNALWLGFMLLLWMVQAGLNVYIRHSLVKYRVNLEEAVHILEALQVVVAVYFMSAFILRFVFPAFSIERRTAWIIMSAPFDLARVYKTKFVFYAVLFLVLGAAVAAVNVVILNLPLAEAALFFMLVFVAIAFLTALGLAIGALFPNFETDDPEILSTSMPGLGLTVLCLAYGALGASLLYDVLGGASFMPLAGFIAASLVGIAALAGLPPRSLQRMEFGVSE